MDRWKIEDRLDRMLDTSICSNKQIVYFLDLLLKFDIADRELVNNYFADRDKEPRINSVRESNIANMAAYERENVIKSNNQVTESKISTLLPKFRIAALKFVGLLVIAYALYLFGYQLGQWWSTTSQIGSFN